VPETVLRRRLPLRVVDDLVEGRPHPLQVIGVHVVEGVLSEEFLRRIAEHPLYGGALVPDDAGGLHQRHEVRGVLGKGLVAFLALAHAGVEAGPANGQARVVAHGQQNPQVVWRQSHPTYALHVEQPHDLAPVEERDADL
jgi:hypothetical protein